ncbi:hypothetical protein LINPERPRIM_LOCUS38988 [Linum perenne]
MHKKIFPGLAYYHSSYLPRSQFYSGLPC